MGPRAGLDAVAKRTNSCSCQESNPGSPAFCKNLKSRKTKAVCIFLFSHQHVAAQNPGNVVVSPVSIKLVLAMLREGAAGNTGRELEQTLNLHSRLQSRMKFSAILDSLMVRTNIVCCVPHQPSVRPPTIALQQRGETN
jgi:hypothetical protein